MAQAPLKSAKSAAGGHSSKNGSGTNSTIAAATTKKGARVAKPKGRKALAGARRADTVLRKYTVGLTALTERTLGARAGHLELLGGARRKGRIGADGGGGKGPGGKGSGGAKAGKAHGESAPAAKKGGTKKFG